MSEEKALKIYKFVDDKGKFVWNFVDMGEYTFVTTREFDEQEPEFERLKKLKVVDRSTPRDTKEVPQIIATIVRMITAANVPKLYANALHELSYAYMHG